MSGGWVRGGAKCNVWFTLCNLQLSCWPTVTTHVTLQARADAEPGGIRADIAAVEREAKGLLGELLPRVRSTVVGPAPASLGIGGLAVREPPWGRTLRDVSCHSGA